MNGNILEEPGLVLTPSTKEESSNNDGLLTASEIRDLKLNAEIVILSACNTAAGDIDSDEGLSGLASAFIFAGAKSIVASHWSVDDLSTQLLVSNFFKNLKDSYTLRTSEAMRLSMLKLFKNKKYSHPIFLGTLCTSGAIYLILKKIKKKLKNFYLLFDLGIQSKIFLNTPC